MAERKTSNVPKLPSWLRSSIYSLLILYLFFGIVWTIMIGQHTHELVAEHGTRTRYNEITKVVRAQQIARAVIEVCVEGRRLEIDDPDGYAFDIPTWSVENALEESTEELLGYQSVLLAREQVKEDCSPPNEYPIDVLQFELGSVNPFGADKKLGALRPAKDRKVAVYELAVSWDGGATISEKRLVALVTSKPRLNERHYVVFRIQPTVAKGVAMNPLHFAGNILLDIVTFPYQLAALISYASAH